MNKHPLRSIYVTSIMLIILGLILIIGGILAFRALGDLKSEFDSGHHSTGTIHKHLGIQSASDLESTEYTIYQIAFNYRKMSITFSRDLSTCMKLLIMIGISISVVGMSNLKKLRNNKKRQNQSIEAIATTPVD